MSSLIIIGLSFVLALTLEIVPLPASAPIELGYLRPDWIVLVLFYWVIALPQRVGAVIGWCVGLLADVLTGSLLGLHAFTLVLVAWTGTIFYQRMRMFSVWQQSAIVMMVITMVQVVSEGIESIVGRSGWNPLQLMSVLISGLFWPWVFLLLRWVRRRFGVT